jgi:hypothetical protein
MELIRHEIGNHAGLADLLVSSNHNFHGKDDRLAVRY